MSGFEMFILNLKGKGTFRRSEQNLSVNMRRYSIEKLIALNEFERLSNALERPLARKF